MKVNQIIKIFLSLILLKSSPYLTIQTLNYLNIYNILSKNIKFPKYVKPTIRKLIITNSIVGIGVTSLRNKIGFKKNIDFKHLKERSKLFGNKENNNRKIILILDILTHWIPLYLVLKNYNSKFNETKINGFSLYLLLMVFYLLTLYFQLIFIGSNDNFIEDLKKTYALTNNELIKTFIFKFLMDTIFHFA